MIDTRREALHIAEEFQRYQQKVGETIVWFMFNTAESSYNSVYDEGGRSYWPGTTVPILWVDQIEPPEQYLPEGRRPVFTLRFAVSAKVMSECGIGAQESTGHRTWDQGLINGKWFNDRVNDIIYYDGRYYEVSNFQIRGRIREDVIIGISCTETYIEDERLFDIGVGPVQTPPDPVPPSSGFGLDPYGAGPYGGAE